MKLVSYHYNELQNKAGIIINEALIALPLLDERLPDNMRQFLQQFETNFAIAREALNKVLSGALPHPATVENYLLTAPVPEPASVRDGYAFRQHVAAARRNRRVDMIPEFDQYPIFYFTNHNALQGPGAIKCMPDHFQKLDFELEVAVVIGKRGRNIKAADADEYIAGFTIMNDMSARVLQMEEMLLSLGPAKGKDFSTAIGPWLVTKDELEQYICAPQQGHTGVNYNLKMTCKVNGIQVSEGNMADMTWTFAEIIERCSYGADIFPGDVIGSGTVGTGCFLELNGTGLLHNPDYKVQWLQPGDKVVMDITGLGTLENTIEAEASDFSILALKKK